MKRVWRRVKLIMILPAIISTSCVSDSGTSRYKIDYTMIKCPKGSVLVTTHIASGEVIWAKCLRSDQL